MMRPLATTLFAGLMLCALPLRPAVAADQAIPQAQLDFFEKKVRPVLIEHCYKCHSQDEKAKGNLQLDSKAGWMQGGDSGPALVPGDADKSLLIQAVRYDDPNVEMPPKGKIPDAHITILEQWVKMGAPDPRTGKAAGGPARTIDLEAGRKHWAYQPLAKPDVPKVTQADWAKNDIDRFILARLEAASLPPSPDADRATLARRVYFDLIGLPPTPGQIDAFVNDQSADAYEKLVDSLLASPHFGERWGRHWLDVARFAESLTLRGFIYTDTWRYRDYVIESFNLDRPFDRFMQEQVAGDLMTASSHEERTRQLAATAFLAMGNTNLEEQDKKQLVMDVVDEQIDTIGRAFLGQTIGCARCHDHKFDPIPAADYYALAGIFKSTQALEHANVSQWIHASLPMSEEREAEIRKHETAVAALQEKLKSARSELAALTKKTGGSPVTLAVVALKDLPGIVVDDAKAKRVGAWVHSTHVKPYVGDGYLHDDNQGRGEKTLTFQPELVNPGRYEVRLAYTTGDSRATKVPVTVFSADGDKTIHVNQRQTPAIDGRWVSLGVFLFEKNGQGFAIVSNEGANGHVIADAVQFLPVDQPAVAATTDVQKPATGDAAKILAKAAPPEAPPATAQKTAEDEQASLAAQVKQIEQEIKTLQQTSPKRDRITSIREAATKDIGDTKIHVRGSVHTLGETAPRGFLQVVPVKQTFTIPADQSGRLELGQWLSHRDNPLPARVIANRIWHWTIGQGLVRTVDNFGLTGESPSHPELLDHLATQFVEQGWSVKKLVREIVLSRTYHQASTRNSELASTRDSELETRTASTIDPDNKLLWRMNRRRLEAEAIRDAMLVVSGELDRTMGGPTYKPGISADYNYQHTDVRRSVYAPVFRNALPELFEVFDFADPSVSTGKRNTSTVAPQALFLLNHPFVAQRANAAAKRLLAEQEATTDDAKIDHTCRMTLGRAPTAGEIKIARQFLGAAANGKMTREQAWAQWFHALFASMDFRYVN